MLVESDAFDVVVAVADSMTIIHQSAHTAKQEVIATAPAVRVVDEFGVNNVSGVDVTVSLNKNDFFCRHRNSDNRCSR